jgi:ABC-type dipeptide/oligopeptide/nickel transport system permease subunit
MLRERRRFLYPIPTRRPLPSRWPTGKPERRPLSRNVAAIAAIVFLILVSALVLLAPVIARPSYAEYPQLARRHPSLGTDLLGRDVLSRLLYGGRLTFGVGLLAAAVAALPGLMLGLIAGYSNGWLDALITRTMDVLLSIPYLLLALTVVALMGQRLEGVALGIGLAGIPGTVRVVRAAVVGVRRRPFVLAARSIGCTEARILWRHILPNVTGTVLVIATLQVGWAILNASALTFLGVGARPRAGNGRNVARGKTLRTRGPLGSGWCRDTTHFDRTRCEPGRRRLARCD